MYTIALAFARNYRCCVRRRVAPHTQHWHMHRDHWSHRLQQLRSTQFVDDNPSLTHLLSFRALRCARLINPRMAPGIQSQRLSRPLSLFLSFVLSRRPATSNFEGGGKQIYEYGIAALSRDSLALATLTLPPRGLYRRHIRTSSVPRCHSSRRTSMEPLSRRSLQFARPSPLPVDL